MDISANFATTAPTANVSGASDSSSVLAAPSRVTAQTVLIIDDNHDNLQLASFVAEQKGCRVLTATSAQEAFNQLHPGIDLILLDIILPDMDGFSVLKQIRRSSSISSRTPIVAVTALASSQERNDILAAGFSGYLCKPYTIDALEQVLQQPCNAA